MSKNIPSKKHYFVVKMLFSLLIVAAFLLTGFTHINAGTTPTTSILDVVEDVSVTIRTYDFPANQNFTVTMGKFGTRGVGGYIVETFNSGTGGSFDKTFTIPAVLLDETKIAIRLESPQGYYAFDWFYNSNDNVPIDPVIPSGYTGIPTVTVKSVVAGVSVTLVTHNFPADTIFAVTMGEYGTLGVGGIKVADTDSGTGGSFEVTYSIPASLKENYRITIRLQSSDGFYAYNWFYNASATAVDGYTGIPTTAVKSVDPGVSVTLTTYNFPPDQVFVVTMGEFGTRGVGGIKVADTDSGTGGSFEVTYLIPAALKDNEKIAIRLESPEGYYAYDWFTNKTPSTPIVSGYTGYPTTSIKSVNPGVSVTITTYNFPPDMDFEITMGAFGTRGVGGTVIKTINSGTGGSFDVTCDIPAAMADWDRIAIRFQGDPYYAYDWFYN